MPAQKVWILYQSVSGHCHSIRGRDCDGTVLFFAVRADCRRDTYDLYGRSMFPLALRRGGTYEDCSCKESEISGGNIADDF